MLLLLLACLFDVETGLEEVPVLAGYHCAQDRETVVLRVFDGDTLYVQGLDGEEESIRLLGVDAPEVVHPDHPTDDCYGPEARDFAAAEAVGMPVRLSFDQECTEANGRTLAYVYLQYEDGEILLNQRVIREGYAQVYAAFDDIRLAPLLYTAQSAAQEENLGQWAACQ